MQDLSEAAAAPSPALIDFQPLIGLWTAKITWSEKTHKLIGGPASVGGPAAFGWSGDGGFLMHTVGGGGAPLATWMIGRDDASRAFTALYADSRGVSRIYEMSFARDVWKLWRTAPGFHQRFEGQISPDRRSIEARWEKSNDGSAWEIDFDLYYARAE